MFLLPGLRFHCVRCAGTGDREGDSYQGVNVDDGTEAVGAVGQLVYQTTPLHVCLGSCLSYPYEGLLLYCPNVCLHNTNLKVVHCQCVVTGVIVGQWRER